MENFNDDITIFRYEYFFLSNFFPCVITIDGITYSSSEAAFQAQKTTDLSIREEFAGITPAQAKLKGKNVKLRCDWETNKLSIMEYIIRQKFLQNDYLRDKLLETGERNLIEMNNWNDTFWGVSKRTGQGENHLGKILMKVRDELNGKIQIDT